jgi:hypothetical protein
MNPRHTNAPREPLDPLSAFVQLVAPPAGAIPSPSMSEDTLTCDRGPLVSVSAALYVESLDDTLAEEYPLLDTRSRQELNAALHPLIASLRDRIERDLVRQDQSEGASQRTVSIRYGPARSSAMGRSLVWVECRCLETEAYLLPCIDSDLSSLRWRDREEGMPERFHDGPARLLVELDPRTSEILECKPLISPQCSTEAEENLLAALRRSDEDRSSYLLSQYREAIVRRAIDSGELESKPSEEERRDFLRALPSPTIIGVSATSSRVSTVFIRYTSSGRSEGYREEITLQEISPWGLTVTGTTQHLERAAP